MLFRSIEGALFDQAMSAESVAEIGYRGFRRRRRVIIPGLPNRLLAFAVRFAPRAWPAAIVRRLQERRRR